MGARRYQELIAWQLAEAFKQEVFELVLRRRRQPLELKYRTQLVEAARSVTSNIVEGFLRCSPGDFARYLGFSLGSLGETESSVRDGILLGYFVETDCADLFRLGRRSAVAMTRLKQSQLNRARQRKKG